MPDDPTLNDDDPVQIDPAEHQALQAKVAALEAKSAMLEAGVDLSTPTGKMFLRAYEGEPDVEAIKLAAAEIPGALRAVDAPTDDDEAREPGEAEQFADRNALTTDGAAGADDPDPKAVAFGALDVEIAKGVRLEDAMSNTMHNLVHAANSGDERVLAQRVPAR